MIKYEYTAFNRLQNPHQYMYTRYQGEDFIRSYFKDREVHIKRFKSQEVGQDLDDIDIYLSESARFLLQENDYTVNDYKTIQRIGCFKRQNRVITEELLMSLIACQLSNDHDDTIKDWIDFLVQRFEVTKKLYQSYHSHNLHRGEGNAENIRLYWLFSLLLTLYYSGPNNIKYLSTLLKVNDLICSLDDFFLNKIPKQGLLLVLSKEIESIRILFRDINGDLFCT